MIVVLEILNSGWHNLKRNKMKLKFRLSLKPPFILYNDTLCECGEHKKCVRKINASNNGRLWVENKDHFRCGKVRNQIEKLNELFNK